MAQPYRQGLALAGSVLLHGAVLGGLAFTLTEPVRSPPPAATLDVDLAATPAVAPVSAAPPPRPVTRAALAGDARAGEAPSAVETETPGDGADPDTSAARVGALALDAAAAPADGTAIAPVTPAEPVPETIAAAEPEPPGLAARALPPRLELRFDVRYGPASGKQTLLWVNEGERYTLSSVAEASGVAGVFYRGRFVQVSRGRFAAHGLQPEEFWDQRGDKRSSARFEASQLTLVPAKGEPRHFAYDGTAQDALSLFFQLALDAPASAGGVSYTVFNGKKLRAYSYAVRGEVVLETALGPLRTLHLERVGDADGRFEAWLAIDRHYLPVRLLRHDEQGNAIELRLQAIAP